MKPLRNCELCDDEASLYCVSDSAFLCWSCDSRVHEANFLVARHVRRVLCFRCKDFAGRYFSGATLQPISCQCSSCPLDHGDGNSSSSGSICISSAESFTATTKRTEIKKSLSKADSAASQVSVEECLKPLKPTLRRRFVKVNIDIEAEAILTNWCRKLGFGNPCTLPLALHAFGICSQRLHFLPLRVGLACSLLFSSRLCEKTGSDQGQGQDQGFWLKKIEVCSGVPARVIVLAESKLAQILKMKKGHEEGWAECTH